MNNSRYKLPVLLRAAKVIFLLKTKLKKLNLFSLYLWLAQVSCTKRRGVGLNKEVEYQSSLPPKSITTKSLIF